MHSIDLPHDRRRFLRLAAGFSTSALLARCGGGGGGANTTVVPTPGPMANAPAAAPVVAGPAHPLNLMLALAYLGAQYHAVAARGTGLATTLIDGTGQAGAASGGRQVAFVDPLVAALAGELADEKTAQVAALRASIGATAAAQPALDLAGAFPIAARRAGLTAGGQSFDPYAGDGTYLLGAFLIENTSAAAYRTLLLSTVDDASATTATARLADAIYHGGLIRAVIDHHATIDPAVATSLSTMSATLAALDGTDDRAPADGGASVDLLDAVGRPIPFTRGTAQVLHGLYLSGGAAGGFLPMGANGIA